MSNICDFDRILKTECNLHHFTRNCRIKNLDDVERDEADTYLWRAGLLNVKEKENDHMLHYQQVFRNVFKTRDSKFCAILMKHRRKVKGEQVITLQIAQQLKPKNVNIVLRQLFCRQCRTKLLLLTDSLF